MSDLQPEQPVLAARASGMLTADEAFEQFYSMYARVVMAWLVLRADRAAADDLAQDVWTIFSERWKVWKFLPEMNAAEARPVLSFLFRTVQFVVRGHRRLHSYESLDAVEGVDEKTAPDRILRAVEFGRCLEIAKKIATEQDMNILIAKLAGVPAREIAQALEITEAAVDHRFRNVVARLQEELNV